MVSRWSSVCPSVFSFPDDNLRKFRWIAKLGMCIDIVEIWFGIANEQISSIFDGSYLPETCPYFRFQMITWVNIGRWISAKLSMCIDIVVVRFGIALGQISSILRELSARDMSVFSFLDNNLSNWFSPNWRGIALAVLLFNSTML